MPGPQACEVIEGFQKRVFSVSPRLVGSNQLDLVICSFKKFAVCVVLATPTVPYDMVITKKQGRRIINPATAQADKPPSAFNIEFLYRICRNLRLPSTIFAEGFLEYLPVIIVYARYCCSRPPCDQLFSCSEKFLCHLRVPLE